MRAWVSLNEKTLRAQIAVVMPALNPTSNFSRYVAELVEAGFTRIVVVDDGSSPDSQKIFLELDQSKAVTVLRHEKNNGQGASLKTAYRHLISDSGNLVGVVTADADGQHAIQDVVKVADSLEASFTDIEGVVIGMRNLTSSQIPWKSRIGNTVTSAVVKVLFGRYLQDTQTGLRGFQLAQLQQLEKVRGDRFEYNMNVLLDLMGRGVEIRKVSIQTIYHDDTNSVSHFRPLIDSLRIYLIIFRQFLKFASSSLSSAAVDLSLFVLFLELLFQGSSDPTSVVASVVLARGGSTLFNFTVNRKLVFGNKEQKRKTLSRYYVLVIGIMSASAVGSASLAQLLEGHVVWAKIIVDTSLFAISYLAQRHWVFPATRKK